MGAILSLLSGGLLGTIGSLLSNVMDFFKVKEQNKQEVKMKQMDLDAMDKEYEYRETAAQLNADVALTESGDDLREATYDHDEAKYSKGMIIKSIFLKAPLVFVDVVRGLIRPALTVYLIALVTMVFYMVKAIIDQEGLTIDPVEALAIFAQVVDMILFLASMAIGWWFGDRSKKAVKN